MLNSQLDQLGNTFLRNRLMAEEEARGREQDAAANRRADIDQAFRQEALQRLVNEDNRNEAHLKTQEQQQGLADKQKMLQTVIQLNLSGQLDDASRSQVNQWLESDPHFSGTGIQLQKPPDHALKTSAKDAMVVNALKNADQYRQQAQSAASPVQAKQYNDYADMLEQWVRHSAEFKPTPGYEQTEQTPAVDPMTGEPKLDASGKPTYIEKKTTRVPITPGAVSAPAAATPQAGPFPPNYPEATAAGNDIVFQQAKFAIANGKEPAAVKQRFKQATGLDFDTYVPKQQQAVPGFGSAQQQQ